MRSTAIIQANHTEWRAGAAFLLSLLFVLAGFIVLKFAPAPFFWLLVLSAAVLIVGALRVRRQWPSAILLNVGILACLIAGIEAYLVQKEYQPPVFSPGFHVHDDILGWAPAKGMRVHAFKPGPAGVFHGPKGVLFDVTYGIGENGLRAAPPGDPAPAAAILFFGCSFTFGEGLDDSQTLPYRLGGLLGGRYKILNFAFEGYGPHQMLAALEHGLIRRLTNVTPQYAYYVAIPNHVWRVAGRTSFGGHAPRYVLDANGNPYQSGFLEDRKPLALRLGFGERVMGQLDKSAIWRMLSSADYPISDSDIQLYLAVVRRSNQLIQQQFPGVQFKVILWPNQDVSQQRSTYNKLQAGFRQMGIPFDRVEDILPHYSSDRTPYILGSSDHHPNALADRILAEHIANEISGRT